MKKNQKPRTPKTQTPEEKESQKPRVAVFPTSHDAQVAATMATQECSGGIYPRYFASLISFSSTDKVHEVSFVILSRWIAHNRAPCNTLIRYFCKAYKSN